MFDVYFDDATLVKVEPKHGSQILIFRNEGKDEALSIPVSNEELLNVYRLVKIRCEALDLITKADS